MSDSFNFYQHLFQAMPEPFLILETKNQIIQEINARVTDLTGYSASEILGQPVTRFLFLPSGTHLPDYFQINPAGLPTEIKSAEMISKSGKRFPVILVFHLIEWKETQVRLLQLRPTEEPILPEKGSSQGKADVLNEFPLLVGESQNLRQVCRLIGLVAKTDATVLIQGESVTGKEVIANTLHAHSLRN